MSNPEPNGFPQGDPQGGANWPFAPGHEQADSSGQPLVAQSQPAFPVPAVPPSQSMPQYNQQLPRAREYPLSEGAPLPAGAQFRQEGAARTGAYPEPVDPQPVTNAGIPASAPNATVPVEQLSASPISDPVLEEVVSSANSVEPVPAAAETVAATPTQTSTVTTESDNSSGVSATDIEKSLYQQALTPWWLDALMALSLAGVMVFNGFGMSLGLRIGSLILMVIALVLITWYQGDAQEKSNTFLTGTLLGAVCGFLAGLIVVAASLYLVSPIPTWYPWVLWLVSGALLYLTYRGFRDWVMRSIQKKSRK